MVSSDYHLTDVHSPEHYHNSGEEEVANYSLYREPQLPSHNHLDQTIFQDYGQQNTVNFPTPYAHDQEAQEKESESNDAILNSQNREKEPYNRTSTSAAIYNPTLEEKVANDQNIDIPEASNDNDGHAAGSANASDKDQEENHKHRSLRRPHDEDTSEYKRNTLIGDDEKEDEKFAMSNQQSREAQELENEMKLRTKIEQETKNRSFQPETEPEAVYVPSVKLRTDTMNENCCLGCLAWICCLTSASGKK
ncbi:hypothetical protein [Parasitella parasitica]|uniref:Uncharacterized protein n=1 Tax=Parasitella parasitica TaxID=35722 RepID=A0A0B7NR46_9FUNG|nr:hypothetical protein [Parasitella parasitica]